MRVDAFCVQVKPAFWPKRSGGAAGAMMPGFATFGVGADLPKQLSLRSHLVRVRKELDRAGRAEEFVPALQRSSDASTYGYCGGRLQLWSPADGSFTPVTGSLLKTLVALIGELEANASETPLARPPAKPRIPEYATAVTPRVGAGKLTFGQNLDQVRRAGGRAPLVRVYPREGRVHEWREGLELIFLPARASAPPVLSIIRFNDGCTPQLGGVLLYSRAGRALTATWRSKKLPAGLTAYPDVSLYRAADGSFLASTSAVADAVVVRLVADQGVGR